MILMTQEMIQTTFMTCSLLSHCVIKWFWWHKRWYRLHVMTCSLYLIVSQMIWYTRDINTFMTLVCSSIYHKWFDDTRDDTDYTLWRVVCIISLYHQMILMTQEMIQTTFMTCSLLSHCVIKWFWWHKRWYRLHVMTCSLYLIVSQMIWYTRDINTFMTLVCIISLYHQIIWWHKDDTDNVMTCSCISHCITNDFDDTRDDKHIHDVSLFIHLSQMIWYTRDINTFMTLVCSFQFGAFLVTWGQ